MRVEKRIGRILTKHNWTLSTAESCSGGYLANKITDVAGSSNYFSNGYITYSNESKFQNLDVPIISLEEFGVYSSKTAELMAEGVRKKTNTTFGIATTGIAPPGDPSSALPTGTTFIGLATAKSIKHYKFIIRNNSRRRFKKKVVNNSLRMLLALIQEYENDS